MSEDSVTDSLKDFIERLFCCLIRSHGNDLHGISQLIAEIPSIKFLGVVIVAERCRAVEGVCERRVDFNELFRVQVKGEADLCLSSSR